jgi:hypothetical protein
MTKISLRIENAECVMDGLVFFEKIDVNILDALIESDLLKKQFNHKMVENYYENEKEQLTAYRNIIKKGYANVKYSKVKVMAGWGRVNPNKGLGLFNIRRELRQTLSKGYYVDIDAENAHPSVLLQVCKANKITCKYLEEYVTNRDKHLQETMELYNVSRDQAKRLFIILMYLGGFEGWAEDINSDTKKKLKPSSFIVKIKDELKKIGSIFNETYKDLGLLVEKNKKQKNISKYNKQSSIISFVLQEWECQILSEMYKYMCEKGYINNRDCVLCADGIMIPSKTYKPELLKELNELIKSKFNLNIIFTQKEMKQDYLNEINKILLLKEAEKKEQQDYFKNQTANAYNKMKEEVEQNYFFIEDVSKFGYYNKENNNFLIKSSTALELNLAPYQYDKVTEKGTIKQSFYDSWIRDSTRRSYESIIFDPQNKDKKKFNLFTGFELENKEYEKKSTKNIHKMLDHVLHEYKNHCLEWLSFILKNKCKSNIALLLYSENHGIGKNTVVELFLKMMDKKYTSKLENIDELTSQFNGFNEGALLIYGDEILAKNKELYTFLKNTITRTEVKINKKGVESYKIKDLANYIFTTNERVAFKIEERDRRLSIIDCTEIQLTDDDYINFYKELDDQDIMCSFFNELMEMNPPIKMKALETKLKSEIQEIYTPSPIKFLFKNWQLLNNKKISTQEVFEMIKTFEKENKYTECKTSIQVGIFINRIADFKHRTNKGSGFYFKDLDVELKKYNLKLFEEYQI